MKTSSRSLTRRSFGNFRDSDQKARSVVLTAKLVTKYFCSVHHNLLTFEIYANITSFGKRHDIMKSFQVFAQKQAKIKIDASVDVGRMFLVGFRT